MVHITSNLGVWGSNPSERANRYRHFLRSADSNIGGGVTPRVTANKCTGPLRPALSPHVFRRRPPIKREAFRIIARKHGDGVRLYSRYGNALTAFRSSSSDGRPALALRSCA